MTVSSGGKTPRDGLRERIESEVTAFYVGDQRFVVVPDRFLLTLESEFEALDKRIAKLREKPGV